jgi:hypothetical protein
MRRWLVWLVVAVAAGVSLAMLQSWRQSDGQPTPGDDPAQQPLAIGSLIPDPRYSPQDVVRIQLEALRTNGRGNGGIEQAFRFASPANRAQIGSVQQFARIVASPAYRPMVNHLSAVVDGVQVDGDRAQQMVVLTSSEHEVVMYVFLLSRQRGGDFDGCWMTDGVMRVEGGPPMQWPEDEPRPAAPPRERNVPV